MSPYRPKSKTHLTGITFDTGALLGLEANSKHMLALLKLASAQSLPIAIPAGVLAQAWRDGSRQARLAHLLHSPFVNIVPLTASRAKAIGALCKESSTADVIDASVILCAKEHQHTTVVTSDPGDLKRIDSSLKFLTP